MRPAALALSLVVRSLPLATRIAHATSRSNLPASPRRLRGGGGAGGLSSTFFLAISLGSSVGRVPDEAWEGGHFPDDTQTYNTRGRQRTVQMKSNSDLRKKIATTARETGEAGNQ